MAWNGVEEPAWTFVEEKDAPDEEAAFRNSATCLWGSDTSHKTVSIVLVDGSARARRDGRSFVSLVPSLSDADFYVGMVYGDYPPWSASTVETFYMGGERQGLHDALARLDFVGGSALRNAFHEGIAACLDCSDLLAGADPTKFRLHVAVACCTLPYEHFYSNTPTRCCSTRYLGLGLERLFELFRERRIRLSILCSHKELAATMLSLLSKSFSSEEIREHAVDGGVLVALLAETTPRALERMTQSISSESPPSVSPSLAMDDVNGELETAVKQFLATVLRMPPGQRAEAIKKHLESPAYSAEYKQAVVRLVKQMQQTIATKKTSPPPPPPSAALDPKSALPMQKSPAPLWRGRIAFQFGTEMFFEVAGFPVANPKSATPNVVPHPSEFMVEGWPLVLAVTSFVSVQAPAVAKIVPISRLVELVPVSMVDGRLGQADESMMVLRNLLVGRQMVGLVRLGANQVMLIAARPHQLVGMVISKHVAAGMVSPELSPQAPLTRPPPPAEPAHLTRAQAQAIRQQQQALAASALSPHPHPHLHSHPHSHTHPLTHSHTHPHSQSQSQSHHHPHSHSNPHSHHPHPHSHSQSQLPLQPPAPPPGNQTPHPSQQQSQPVTRKAAAPLLTPDAILRQLHSMPRSAASMEILSADASESSNLDVFNALIGSHSIDVDGGEDNLASPLEFPGESFYQHLTASDSFFDLDSSLAKER